MARFDDLPPELVGVMWSFLGRNHAARRHVCKVTVPYVRLSSFGETRIFGRGRLLAFDRLLGGPDPPVFSALSRSILDDTHLGHYVTDLSLSTIAYSEVRDKTNETAAALRILVRCEKLQSLGVDHSGALHLHLCDLDGEHVPLFDMKCFVHLRRFPSLRTVHICINWDRGEETEVVARPRKVPEILQVKSLHLFAGETLSTSGAANFIAHFPRLETLELTVRGAVDVGPFLQACPTSIKDLIVQLPDDGDDEDPAPLNIDADLARFVNLTHLTLGRCTYAPSCEVFPILATHLPHLSSLTLLHDTPLVAAKLLPFVRSRGGPSGALKCLVIDSFFGHAYPRPSSEPDRADVRDGTFSFPGNWTLPRWTRAFTHADARELLALAKKVGVELTGSIFEAIEVEELRVREEAYVQERRDEVLYSLRGLFGEDEL
ncbi:hypothetical protein JCM10449v2_003088 [Rhodotorula kratochvilovae]